jgi:hypothetical protein
MIGLLITMIYRYKTIFLDLAGMSFEITTNISIYIFLDDIQFNRTNNFG